MTDASPAWIDLRLVSKTPLAQGIWRLEWAAADGQDLPAFTPGAHVVVRTPGGAKRAYSLVGDPTRRDRYVLGVKREPNSRGGSRSLIDEAQVGEVCACHPPANHFELVPAPRYLFIAGGIGITPILSMVRHLHAQGQADMHLVYCTRDEAGTPFLDELRTLLLPDRLTLHHDGGDPARRLDLWPMLAEPTKAHVYCCGPRPMMDEVRDMTGHWPTSQVHFEDFGSDLVLNKPEDRAFTVRRESTGEVVEVARDQTILDALRAHGHAVPSSCESGTCGSCRTRLVSGEVDHRDMVLDKQERRSHIMVCVSRARGNELVLDW